MEDQKDEQEGRSKPGLRCSVNLLNSSAAPYKDRPSDAQVHLHVVIDDFTQAGKKQCQYIEKRPDWYYLFNIL